MFIDLAHYLQRCERVRQLGEAFGVREQKKGNRVMENAQLISLSRQIALRRQMDVVANNVANINTSGFKAESLLFEEFLMPIASDGDFPIADQTLSYTQDWATIHNLTNGAINQTGNTLDVALQGDGFLTIQSQDGDRYTRNGALQIDNTGLLVDLNGLAVLGQDGPIQFAPGETNIVIAPDGTITSSAGNKGKLSIVTFEDPQALTREGDNLFAGGVAIPDENTKVIQGAIERSNVAGVTEMANMIRINRAYQTIANIMKSQNELRQTAIKRLGELSA